MTNSQATLQPPRRLPLRAFLICGAVAAAVAIPILPLKLFDGQSPDFPDVSQVMSSGKSWFSKVAAHFDGAPQTPVKEEAAIAPTANSPAGQVKMLEIAAQQLVIAIEKTPDDPTLHNKLGLVYLSLGDIDRACEQFQTAVACSRAGISVLTTKISDYKTRGLMKEAAEALLGASQLNVQLSAAHSNLARVYEVRGEHDKVLAQLDLLNKEGILFDNNSAQPQRNSKTLSVDSAKLLARAEALMQAGQFQQSAMEFKRVLLTEPNIAVAHHRLGTIMALSNNPAMAVEELEIATKLDPSSPETQNDLGLAYQAIGNPDRAQTAFERAFALDPQATEAAVNLSNAYASKGQFKAATGVLTKAVQSNPLSAKAHNNLGSLLALEGKLQEALGEFQKAISLEPAMPSAHYGLGSVLLATRRYLPAVGEFKQALALNPKLSQAQLKIEEAYKRANQDSVRAQAL